MGGGWRRGTRGGGGGEEAVLIQVRGAQRHRAPLKPLTQGLCQRGLPQAHHAHYENAQQRGRGGGGGGGGAGGASGTGGAALTRSASGGSGRCALPCGRGALPGTPHHCHCSCARSVLYGDALREPGAGTPSKRCLCSLVQGTQGGHGLAHNCTRGSGVVWVCSCQHALWWGPGGRRRRRLQWRRSTSTSTSTSCCCRRGGANEDEPLQPCPSGSLQKSSRGGSRAPPPAHVLRLAHKHAAGDACPGLEVFSA